MYCGGFAFDLLYQAVMLVICMSHTPTTSGTADKVIMIYYRTPILSITNVTLHEVT
jgi:hypothetical protein